MLNKITMVFFLVILVFFSDSCSNRRATYRPIEDFIFKDSLSAYDFFQGDMKDLIPNKGIITYELKSPLFTDYAQKQRLIKLPKNGKILVRETGSIEFPNETVIAKTFYYNLNKEKKVIETRVLIMQDSIWNFSVYQWNSSMSNAYLIEEGATVNLQLVLDEKLQKLNYKIPSRIDCVTCHKQGNEIEPLGPKIDNINNQFWVTNFPNITAPLKEKDKLANKSKGLTGMVDYRKEGDLEQRARSYLNINCAHCHNPEGMANLYGLDLEFSTPINETGILKKGKEMVFRMKTDGPMHMPKIGVTLTHEEGMVLIERYILSLK